MDKSTSREENVTEISENSGIDSEQTMEKMQDEEIENESLTFDKEEPKPLDYWEYKSGVIMIPCDGSRNALEAQAMTREEYIDKLENSVSIIKEAGKAEDFFRNKSDEWEKVRNSKEEFQRVILEYGNDLPVDIDTTEVYVLYQNDEDTIHNAEREVINENVNEELEEPKQKDIEIIKKHLSSEIVQKYAVITAKEALDLTEKGMLNDKEVENIAANIEKVQEDVIEEDAMKAEEQNEKDKIEEKTVDIFEEMTEETMKEVDKKENDTKEELEIDREEQVNSMVNASLGEELIYNVLTDSINNSEMVDDIMDQKALRSVTAHLRDGLSKGIEENIEQEVEEEYLPGYGRRP